ncbi:endonuclease domain-containing protein [Candidatus Absconditicoccus praedator]|uniref:endonuclease domain-containing protein n=1 Tax=Candidatus Absconditicoccus praedator TaxID=2735562 RepID=UPI001E504834|nr:DUF559 domain-containing protein [Candidatus Absconditicoccus praedator]UFX82599.1 endonuclease domain-containing protein [Candidatus Absconditicoccus praedator]
MKNKQFINYDKSKKDFARQLRSNQTKAEGIFWHMVLKFRPLGYKFTRQKPISSFIADFYCSKLLLVIELDGESHNEKVDYDNERSLVFQRYGIKVIRYNNYDIFKNLEAVQIDLENKIKDREKEFFGNKR